MNRLVRYITERRGVIRKPFVLLLCLMLTAIISLSDTAIETGWSTVSKNTETVDSPVMRGSNDGGGLKVASKNKKNNKKNSKEKNNNKQNTNNNQNTSNTQNSSNSKNSSNNSNVKDQNKSENKNSVAIEKNGYYYDLESVVIYIDTYGHLPNNFITKKEAEALGWQGGSVEKYKKGAAIGGNRFGNYEGKLPNQNGIKYTECDIDTKGSSSRGAKRLIFSSNGKYYYTDDHYETFKEIVIKDGKVTVKK